MIHILLYLIFCMTVLSPVLASVGNMVDYSSSGMRIKSKYSHCANILLKMDWMLFSSKPLIGTGRLRTM